MKHCKVNYKVIIPYSDETLTQVIEVKGISYEVNYLPRPCKNERDVFAVFHNGVRFSTFAKFLKSVNN